MGRGAIVRRLCRWARVVPAGTFGSSAALCGPRARSWQRGATSLRPLRVLPELPALLLLGLPQLLGGAVRLRALPTRSRRDQDEVVLQFRYRFPGDQPGDEAILRPGLSSEALRGSLMPKLSSGPCWVSWWAPSLHTSSTKLPIRR